MRRLLDTLRMFRPVLGRLPAGHLARLWRMLGDERPHRFGRQVRIDSFFPPWPSPAFDRFCAALAARRRVPQSTYLAVTSRCPCACPHCSYGRRPAAEPSTAALLDLVAQVKGLGGAILGFTGGEPLLRPDLATLVRAAAPELATILFTTGHGLDRARAAELAAAGLSCVTLGVERADPAAHDAVRRVPGSFEMARAAAAAARAAGLYVALSMVATRDKLADGELPRLRALAEAWGARELRILSPGATGRLAGEAAAMLGPAERAALSAFHVRANRAGRAGPVVACAAHLEADARFGCGAGYHHLFIDAAGEVCPCDLLPVSFGRALGAGAEPLAAIWARMGETFGRPRCGCALAAVAPALAARALPVAAGVVPVPPADGPLPRAYERLLTRRAR